MDLAAKTKGFDPKDTYFVRACVIEMHLNISYEASE